MVLYGSRTPYMARNRASDRQQRCQARSTAGSRRAGPSGRLLMVSGDVMGFVLVQMRRLFMSLIRTGFMVTERQTGRGPAPCEFAAEAPARSRQCADILQLRLRRDVLFWFAFSRQPSPLRLCRCRYPR